MQPIAYSEIEVHETIALPQALQLVIVSKNVLADHVHAILEHYKSVHSQDDYEMACSRECFEVERQRKTIITEHLKEFDANRVADRERTDWSWYPLYHICTTNCCLEERLPPLPWSHFVDEVINVYKAFSYERIPMLTKLAEACLL